MPNNSNRAYISELRDTVGQDVTLAGWLYQSRSSGKIQFMIICDGTGLCQCVVEKGKIPDELFETLGHLGQERKMQFLFKVVIPTHRLFFRAISINDDFHCDAILTFRVLLYLRHTVFCLYFQWPDVAAPSPLSAASPG
jgi:hypothetical protein